MSSTPIAEVVFRGIIGEGMRAPVVRMPVHLNDEVLSDCVNVVVMFAVCDKLNESCTLSVPTVNLLNDVLNKKLSLSNDVNTRMNDVNCESICINAAITRSKSACQPDTNEVDSNATDMCGSRDNNVDHNSDEQFIDVDESNNNIREDIGSTNSKEFANEQLSDTTLSKLWTHARRGKAGYFIKNELLFHKVKRCGQILELLVIPTPRREGHHPLGACRLSLFGSPYQGTYHYVRFVLGEYYA